MKNINELVIDKHLSNECLTFLPKELSELEKNAVFKILALFQVSSALNDTDIWKEIATLDSKQDISSNLMLIIGVTKLMRGEVGGLLWLRSNLKKFPSERNLHAYFIALCQLKEGRQEVSRCLDSMISFALSQYPDYLSYTNPEYLTTTSSVLRCKDKNFLITLENSFRNVCMRDIFLNGCWTLEPEFDWLEAELSSGGVIFDIGTNAGVYSLYGSKLVGEKGLVYAFEPNSLCVDLLNRSKKLNGIDNITIVPEAISNQVGAQNLILYAASDHNHIQFSTNNDTIRRSTITGSIKVNVNTIDNYFKNKVLSRLDVVKIDAEGCEKFVLEGGSQIFQQFKPKIIMEINERLFLPNGYNAIDLLDMLKKIKYSVFRLWQGNLMPLDKKDLETVEKSFNIIAVPD